ncbi:MAG: twin-arginine translocase subunit TatC [Planctomycetaceae bacterium]|nr:twin-arginine translocase subunit TatC [Planctomycetaceae bacterium]
MATDLTNRDDELKSMSLGDHLDELRARLILALAGFLVAAIIGFIGGKWFLHVLFVPYDLAMQKAGLQVQLLADKPAEKFMAYIKAALVLSLLISSPWLFYQIWAFVAAGLYKHERKFVKVAAPASSGLFITGVVFFILVVGPLMFKFFMLFDPGLNNVTYMPNLTDSLNLILLMALIFGLAFQTPIAIIFAERMGLVTVANLVHARKYAVLAAVIIGAVATPSADIVSQLALAIPLYMLYEASILVCRFWRKKRKAPL